MLQLPKTLGTTVLNAFQKHLESQSITEVLSGLTAGTRELFGAQDAFLLFESEANSQPIYSFSTEELGLSEEFTKCFFEKWQSSQVHQRLKNDLLLRLSPISYSAFSWPYARFEQDRDPLSGDICSIPRDYSILLPISSDTILYRTEEPAFFGYVAVFFESFPQISDEVVQLIITLPSLLSDISAAYLRISP